MSEKFKNKYKTQSFRLQGYDYSQNGMYFVTTCTKDREEFFGHIEDGKMILNEMGKMADKFWKEIPVHFPHAKLDAYQIMPNHIHGILEICWDLNNEIHGVEAQNFAPLRADKIYKNKFGPQSKNLASIIRGFKVGVKKYSTKNEIDFVWQSRFHDHIIRDEKSLNKIREYILTNPETWERDRNNIKT